MQNTEQNNIPGLLLSIDFEKAFDSVSWSFIYKVMEFFGFGNSIISWIKTFNNNIKLSVNQCGNLSSFFRYRPRLPPRRSSINFSIYPLC